MTQFTIPGLTDKQGVRLAELLQKQLSTYNDLHLTLKHIHWNVVGPNFIGVHEMIDPQVEAVRGFADDVAERIAALGASPEGTPGAIIRDREWDDYSVGRDSVQAHLAALDLVYNGVIEDIRKSIDETEELDPRDSGPLDRPGGGIWRSSNGSSGRISRARAGNWPTRERNTKRMPPAAREGRSRNRPADVQRRPFIRRRGPLWDCRGRGRHGWRGPGR